MSTLCTSYATPLALHNVQKVETGVMRRMAVEEDRRADGRRRDEVRPITCRAGLLPATHGSALFTRGQTQTIAVATLGDPRQP